MVWAAFSSVGKLSNSFLKGRQNRRTYIHMLQHRFLNKSEKMPALTIFFNNTVTL